MANQFLKVATLVFFASLFAQVSYSQVTIAPTSLFIDEQNRFGSFLVLNGSDQTQEVELEFLFGYPTTDEEGNIYMEYEDEKAEQQYSIADWIRGFPRSFTLDSGERQTVRLTVQPPPDLEDGTYWTRIKTTSNALSPDIDEEQQEGVTARIAFQFEQVSAGFYRKGEVNTGLQIKNAKVDVDEDEASIHTHIEREGNSPYLGTMFVTVEDADGRTRYENENSLAVYMDVFRVNRFDISEFPEGDYTAHIRFETTRGDISDSDLIQAEPEAISIDFTID